jgi:CRISPR-associated protein Cmr6
MQAQHFTAMTAWRMVVGLGGETVLETDLTLHHLYGIPFIPGSALKGLTRAYVTGEVEEYKSRKIEDDKSDIQRIFGTQKEAGSVIFFDAMPVNDKIKIDLDIMNVHYPKY